MVFLGLRVLGKSGICGDSKERYTCSCYARDREPMIIRLHDTAPADIDLYVEMNDRDLKCGDKLVRSLPGPRPANGAFIAESRRVIERALDAGLRPISMFMEERWLEPERSAIERVEAAYPSTPIYVADRELFRSLTGYEVTRGALAAFERPALPAPEEVLAGAHRIVVLENVLNHTNMGTLFRSAAALGYDGILLTPSSHDPLYRRAARVSVGCVFQISWTYIGQGGEWASQGVPLLHEHGFKIAAMALSDDSIPLDEPALAQADRLALVLGNENEGLSSETIAACDWTVRIPMSHNVDSLNVSAAAAIAFWELRAR